MKKSRLNLTDVLLITVLVFGIAAIVLRAVHIPLFEPVRDREYAVSFTAQITGEQRASLVTGLILTDNSGRSVKRLEGYWIDETGSGAVMTGDLLMKGRVTESGFLSGSTMYYEGDEVTLTYKDGTVDVTLTGFHER